MIGNVELEQIAATIEKKLKKVFDSIRYPEEALCKRGNRQRGIWQKEKGLGII